MTWWEASAQARSGKAVRLPRWGDSQRIVFAVDNAGGSRAVAQLELISPAGVVTRRVVRAADFGEAEFSDTAWEVVG